MRLTILYSILAMSFLVGCSSNNLPETKPFFRGTILDDDTKLFTFNLLIKRSGEEEEGKEKNKNGQKRAKGQGERPQKGGKGEGAKGKGNKSGGSSKGPDDKGGSMAGKNMADKGNGNQRNNERLLQFEQMLFDELDNQMSLNSYCRNGYIVLSQDLGRNILSVKGECHESANAQDRKLFLNRG